MHDNDFNPYVAPSSPTENPRASRPWIFLLLPLVIPPSIHLVVRFWIPADANLVHMGFIGMGALVANIWMMTMIDRLEILTWRRYFLECGMWIALLTSAFVTAGIGLR